jgi:phospholipid/cholesterol/gamma-HCH transport system substrate-binding protein
MTPNQNRRTIIVSIFICVALTILIFFVFTLGGQKKTFAKKMPVKVVFDDISGLREGNNVWFSGVKVGTVKNIDLKDNSVVEVTLTIEEKAIQFIHKDAKVKLSNEGLLGNKLVVIYGGTKSTPIIRENDYLQPQASGTNTDEMMATLQENNKNLLSITNNLKVISLRIAEGQGSIGKLINDPGLANNLEATVTTLQGTISNFREASVKGERAVNNLESFTARLNKQGTSINELMTDTTLFTSVKASVTQLKQAVNNASQFTDNLKVAGQHLNNTDNAINVLLNDERVGASLKSTMMNLESSSIKLDEDLEALQHNFLLRGFFKKRDKEKQKEKTKQ